MNKIYFLALAPTGNGISGSDRIFIELAREWSRFIPIEIYTTQEGVEMCLRQNLAGKYLKINKVEKGVLPSNFIFRYVHKIFLGIKLGFSLNAKGCLYSSSDFWMDVFPAVILKIRFPKLKWVATWFMTAPNPIKGFSEGDRKRKYRLSAFLYWLSQLPIRPLIKKYCNYVIVNNEDERKRFPEMNKKGKVVVLLGAVRLDEIKKYQFLHREKVKVYDAVFQGRFHPQKGVMELIDIWREVVDNIPNAKLAMIGDGPLMEKVKLQISNYNLEENVKLFGYLFDGPEKYKIFSQSKIVVHPAFYDSGGMASAEAMVFGLPAVGFSLKAYESYYPKGMVQVATGDIHAFSEQIIKLIVDNHLRLRIGGEALKMVLNNWGWGERAKQLLDELNLL